MDIAGAEHALHLDSLLQERRRLTESIEADSYSVDLYLQRSDIYELLGYPDLAAMDTYKAMLLIDEVLDDSGEYHDEAMDPLCSYIAFHSYAERIDRAAGNEDLLRRLRHAQQLREPIQVEEDEAKTWAHNTWKREAPVKLAHLLGSIGCLKSAYEFVQRTLRQDPAHQAARHEQVRILGLARDYFTSRGLAWDETAVEVSQLPDRGYVRREVYPWNDYEVQRASPAALSDMSRQMAEVAPKLEIRVTELPVLSSRSDPNAARKTVRQLGVFAKSDLAPGEEILRERSILTASSRLHEPICDACGTKLPNLDQFVNPGMDMDWDQNASERPTPCPDCDDTVFCSAKCLDMANKAYHPALCGGDVESIAKEVPPAEAADALYFLLLLRVLAMSSTQGVHPLDLKEVKYIWGDFNFGDAQSAYRHSKSDPFLGAPRTLPFTFAANILLPLHTLEKMDISIFEVQHDLAETWMFNTLYAKFRGTASARMNPRDGRPEVAAVHPLWCMANHSCDPNVQWEWSGEIRFHVRNARVAWQKKRADGAADGQKPANAGGVAKGEEILNHYVDIDLPVKERREWGAGTLGGLCMCERCVWESS